MGVGIVLCIDLGLVAEHSRGVGDAPVVLDATLTVIVNEMLVPAAIWPTPQVTVEPLATQVDKLDDE